MTGTAGVGGAGCAAGDEDALHIKGGDGLFGGDAGQKQRGDAGQAVLVFAQLRDAICI